VTAFCALAICIVWFISRQKKASQEEQQPQQQPPPQQKAPQEAQQPEQQKKYRKKQVPEGETPPKNEEQNGLKNMTSLFQFISNLDLSQHINGTPIYKLKELHDSAYKKDMENSALRKKLSEFYKITDGELSNPNILISDYEITTTVLSRSDIPSSQKATSNKCVSVIHPQGYTFTHKLHETTKPKALMQHDFFLNNILIGTFSNDDSVIILPIRQEFGLDQVKILCIDPKPNDVVYLTQVDSGTIAINEERINNTKELSKQNGKLKALDDSVWNVYKATLHNNFNKKKQAHLSSQSVGEFFVKLASLIHLESKRVPGDISPLIVEQKNFEMEKDHTSYKIFYINTSEFDLEYRNTVKRENVPEESGGLYCHNRYLGSSYILPTQKYQNPFPNAIALCLILPGEKGLQNSSINVSWLSYYANPINGEITFLESESANFDIENKNKKGGLGIWQNLTLSELDPNMFILRHILGNTQTPKCCKEREK